MATSPSLRQLHPDALRDLSAVVRVALADVLGERGRQQLQAPDCAQPASAWLTDLLGHLGTAAQVARHGQLNEFRAALVHVAATALGTLEAIDSDRCWLDTPPASPPEPPTASAQPVRYATGAQCEEIKRLLLDPRITRPERTQWLLRLNTLSYEAAKVTIGTLRHLMDTRPAPAIVAAILGAGTDQDPAEAMAVEPASDELNTVLGQLLEELNSRHITPIERNKMLTGLNRLTLEQAQNSLAKLGETIEYRPTPEALTAARNQLRGFANAHASALGKEEHDRLHLRAGALSATTMDLIQEMQEAEQRLKMPVAVAA